MRDLPQPKLIYVAKIIHQDGYTGAFIGLSESFKTDSMRLFDWLKQLPFISEIKPGQGFTIEIWLKPNYVPRDCFAYLESMTTDDWEQFKHALP